jgi:hypothetical protein
LNARTLFIGITAIGLIGSAALSAHAVRSVRRARMLRALFALLLSYCVLLAAPASQMYRGVDTWQDLAAIGRAVERDAAGRPLILFAADETTRALVDMYGRTSVEFISGPIDSRSIQRLKDLLAVHPQSLVMTQLPAQRIAFSLRRLAHRWGFAPLEPVAARDVEPPWAAEADLHIAHRYALPNGRRYALLGTRAMTSP